MSQVQQHKRDTGAPVIQLTNAAIAHAVHCLEQKPGMRGVRLSLKKTGCSGLSYVVDYIDKPEINDIVLPLEKEYVWCVDNASYPFLKGLKIDYVKQGLNQKFVFENPNETGQCGCGESFTVDDQSI